MTHPETRRAWEWLRWAGVLACLAGVLAGGSFLVSCSSVQRTVLRPPEIAGATFVGDGKCADCHAQYTRKFAGSAHGRIHLEAPGRAGQTGCESCHGPASLHVAQPSLKGGIFNPRQEAGACFNCHVQTHAEFNLPQHHPLPEGKMNCSQCHDPHGPDIRKAARGATLALGRPNEGCAGCHREQARPVVYEHEAMREGCVVCHQPHGSINAKMLVERDNNLCLKCHAQNQGVAVGAGGLFIGKIDHRDYLRLGGCWSSGCHSAVHGSNISPRMLY